MHVHSNYIRQVASVAAYCRCCDIKMPKGTDMISFWSPRGRGMNVHLCLDCSREIGVQSLRLTEPKVAPVKHTCVVCDKPADWIRSTQFAGEHPYCTEHANLEKDFLEEDDSTYWYKVQPEGEINV